jgi:hypothetical protein
MRIALAASLAFCALWFVALKPKPPVEDAPPPAAPAQSAPGKAAEKAHEAVDASNQADQRLQQASEGVDGTAAGAKPAAKPAGKATAEPAPSIDLKKAEGASKEAVAVLRDVSRGKVAVLLFWDRRLSDDRAVHRAVMDLNRRGGRVKVHTAAIGDLADYQSITRGVPVVTSPTVLVIDRAARARAIGGLSVRDELEQHVRKALKVKP